MEQQVVQSPVPAPRAVPVHLAGMREYRAIVLQTVATVTGIIAASMLLWAVVAHMRGWI